MIWAQRGKIELALLVRFFRVRLGDGRDGLVQVQVFDLVSSSPFLAPAELASWVIDLAPESFPPFGSPYLSCSGSDILSGQRLPRRTIREG